MRAQRCKGYALIDGVDVADTQQKWEYSNSLGTAWPICLFPNAIAGLILLSIFERAVPCIDYIPLKGKMIDIGGSGC